MANEFGSTRWAIPEGDIPGKSVAPDDPALVSHEAACLLNPSGRDAEVTITLFFEDRDPVGPYRVRCRRGAPSICDSTIFRIRKPCRATRLMRP